MNMASLTRLLALTASLLLSIPAQADNGPVPTITELPSYPSLQSFDEVMQRPLFNATRRPAPDSHVSSNGDEKQLRETWKLTGVTFSEDLALALFQERKGDKRLRLEAGMPLDQNWQLEEITADGVSLSSGNKLVRLELRQPREAIAAGSSETGRTTSAEGATGNTPTNRNQSGAAQPQGTTNPTTRPASGGNKTQTM